MSATGPVGNKVFAPAIFFIAFREALEASLVIGILSGMLESLVLHKTKDSPTSTQESDVAGDELREQESRALIRRLRKLVSARRCTARPGPRPDARFLPRR